jgi:hypothetical protein
VHDDGVDEAGEEQRVEDVRLERAALRHGARHDGGGGGGKRPLEQEIVPAVLALNQVHL